MFKYVSFAPKGNIVHTLPTWFIITAFIAVFALLAFDLILIIKNPRTPSMREAGVWVGIYVVLALIFAGAIFVFGDATRGTEFVAGWLTEYSLSVDNLFVFVMILAAFKVPNLHQQRALMAGIVIALILRGIFIIAGAALIERFSWIFYIFGAWLVWTAIKQIFSNEEESEQEGFLVRMCRKVLPISQDFNEAKLTVKQDGKTLLTPFVLVLVSLGATDLLFALDSIPAIFGITNDPFIVFTANVFALMGLRQLYFLLGGLLEKLEYLKYGIALILAFIGVKLVTEAMHTNELPFINGGHPIEWAPDITTPVSLIVIVTIIVLSMLASFAKIRHETRK